MKQVIGQEFKNQIGVPLDPGGHARRHPARHRDGSVQYLTYRAIERDGRMGVNVIVRQKTTGRRFSRCPSS